MATELIQSVERAVRILDLIAEKGPMSVSGVAHSLALSRSVAHRFLLTLEQERFLARNRDGKSYRLGTKLFQLGHIALEGMDLRETARPFIEQLCDRASETVHLGVSTEDGVIYIDKIEPDQTIRMFSQLGRLAPSHCTGIGKVLMAYWPAAKVNAYIARGLPSFTVHTITDGETLRAELSSIAERGWSFDNEEHEKGIKCVAAPVRDHEGEVIAAVSVAALSMRTDDDRLDEIRRLVCATAASISERMGYRA
ncbi:MAG: IclR family transcriptional regulator [Bacteroidota bacterium]